MLRERETAAASTPRSSVAISFGSPASESGVTRLDLNDILIRHPQAAFLMRIAGDSMREAGIDDGDLALVDRAVERGARAVVIAVSTTSSSAGACCRRGSEVRLQAADPACADIVAPAKATDFEIWGVVTHVVRPLAGLRPAMFALVDVNNMYVSCERVFRPRADGQAGGRAVSTTTAPASPAATRPRTWA